MQSNRFAESSVLFDTDMNYDRINYEYPQDVEDIYHALILGIKDYCEKTGFKKSCFRIKWRN